MAAVDHEYPVTVTWQGGRDGQGTVTPSASQTKIDLAVPPEFQGAGGASNPEELLTSAIASCYSITLGIIAANRKLPLESLTVEAVGIVEQNGPSFVYKSVAIRPQVVLSAEATDDQVRAATDMAEKADGYCIVTNAVRDKVSVTVEPNVTRA